MKGNCIVAQSGGPTAAINASLCGVYLEMSGSSDVGKVFGGINGIQGILEDRLLDLGPILSDKRNVDILRQTPSSSLGSCRFKLGKPEDKPELYKKAFEIFKKHDIKYFFYIGGNDSMDTIHSLSMYAKAEGHDIRFMGVPKTVDNDLVKIDHAPGYGSCAKFVSTIVMETAQDNSVYDMESVFIIEAMGRDAGWIAISAALARERDGAPVADLIYTPETTFNVDKYLSDISDLRQKKRFMLVVVSEGLRDSNDVYLADTGEVDAFNHKRLGGAGSVLAEITRGNLDIKVRSVELSLLQRSASHITSATDIAESEKLGKLAARGALDGMTHKMPILTRVSDEPYEVEYSYADVSEIANAVKKVPDDFINSQRNHATEKAIKYMRPIIAGETTCIMENNLPVFINLASIYRKSV